MRLREEVFADVEAHIERPATPLDVLSALLVTRSVQAVLLYRLSRRALDRGIPLVPHVLTRLSQLIFTVDIDPEARIGPGFHLPHAQGVVIGFGAVIGCGVRIFHQVTVGARGSGTADRPDGMAVIADGVRVGAGAKILGPVRIGAGARIGANAVVTRDVPAGAIAVGNNRIVDRQSSADS